MLHELSPKLVCQMPSKVREKEGTTDIGVSVDGTWQRRGFSSLNGIVAAVSTSNFKVIDVDTLSRYCPACASKEELRKTDRLEYDKWKTIHTPNCKANYDGSAGSMETTGANIFKRSVERHGVRYVRYYGDGDSKGF